MSETETFDTRAESPQLIVVCGLPGVGKTTVAEAIAERVDGRLLRTDVIRKEIISDPDYTAEESRMVYGELFERARQTV
ncbi:kinase, partial [Halobacteriales archaeon SW_6_65_15]